MPVEILKRPQALRDIEECFVYIAEENLDIGLQFLTAVEESAQQIAALNREDSVLIGIFAPIIVSL